MPCLISIAGRILFDWRLATDLFFPISRRFKQVEQSLDSEILAVKAIGFGLNKISEEKRGDFILLARCLCQTIQISVLL